MDTKRIDSVERSITMNLYFLVIDSQNRLVFKKKLKKRTEAEILMSEYRKLDFVSYILEGKTFAAALSGYGLELTKESAFLTKKELKETLYFTDKKIKELSGTTGPDREVKRLWRKIRPSLFKNQSSGCS